jgi:hypothetical protein
VQLRRQSLPLPVALHPFLQPLCLRVLASVTGAAEQHRWLSTLDRMEQQPGARLAELQQIRSWITNGITLDLVSSPSPIDHDNTFAVRQDEDAVAARIQEYIAFEAIEELPASHPCPFGIQPLHAIIKAGKKPRLVIDLSRNLNDHLRYEYFSYTTVRHAAELSTPDCWYSKLDLSNCFLSFPLHHSILPHFIFRFRGKLYQFVRMPFGLSSAPRICTLLLSVVAFDLRQHGIDRLVRYLDDFLSIDNDHSRAHRSLLIAQHVITAFGLVVNPDKTEGPAQRLTFLGVLFDSIQQTLSCTPERMIELRALLTDSVSHPRLRLTALATLIGKLQFAAQVLPGARPFTRRMIDLRLNRLAGIDRQVGVRRGSVPHQSLHRRIHFAQQGSSVRTDSGFRADVRFWLDHLSRWNGTQRWRSAQSTPIVFASDASLGGFGFYLESAPPSITTGWPRHLQVGAGYSGAWSSQDAHLHTDTGQMTWCELFAVYAALFTYRTVLRDCCALFLVDNETDVHVLNRQATRSARLAGLLREIFTIAVDNNISIYARHRPGVDNVLADFLSRPEKHGPVPHWLRPVPHRGGIDATADSILRTWQTAYPSPPFPLCSVHLVYSHLFDGRQARPSSTSSSATS